MNTPRKHPSIRLTVPVPTEAYDAFTDLADILGKSLGSVMGEWLLDTAPAARAMAHQIESMKIGGRSFVAQVDGLTANVREATEQVLRDAQESARKGASGPAASHAQQGGSGPARGLKKGLERPLTPPSSNTGGKVPSRTKKARGGRS